MITRPGKHFSPMPAIERLLYKKLTFSVRGASNIATAFWVLVAVLVYFGVGSRIQNGYEFLAGGIAVISVNPVAIGLIAVGHCSVGLIAVGGFSCGLFSIGGLSIGLLGSIGGISIAYYSLGGLSIGMFSNAGDGISIGYYKANGRQKESLIGHPSA